MDHCSGISTMVEAFGDETMVMTLTLVNHLLLSFVFKMKQVASGPKIHRWKNRNRVTDDLKRQITLTKAWWSLFLGWIFLCVSESSDRYIRVAAWNLGHLLKLSNYKSQAWPVYFSMHENCHINIRKKVRVTWNVEQVQSTFKCPFCCNQRKKDEHHSVCVVTRQGDP